ncbi:hypothetical protein CRG98_047132 [Punica granatum]|uniref:Uncharacterized protein n=1 Tax=Punica granatum TaxID=22663 RepID=A0A2I0HLW9_PUNGR|nr:hypothetical protein CRG98_047132 [Punica granatum]
MLEDGVGVFRAMPKKNTVSWNAVIAGCRQMGCDEDEVNFSVEVMREGWIPDKYFDLETILQAKIQPLTVVPGKSFIGFFYPDGMDEEGFDYIVEIVAAAIEEAEIAAGTLEFVIPQATSLKLSGLLGQIRWRILSTQRRMMRQKTWQVGT